MRPSMKNIQREPITFSAASAIERDYVYVAGKPDSVDSEVPFSRLFFFDEQRSGSAWVRHDLPGEDIASIAVGPALFGQPRVYCAMSKNGVVEYCWPGGSKLEAIDGAGVARVTAPIFGYVNEIRMINSRLYVCGAGGQIYRREADGWVHFASDFATPARAPAAGVIHESGRGLAHHFTSVDGVDGDDMYVVGHDGEIQYFDGRRWRQCEPVSDEILLRVRCVDHQTVWACGFNGTLLLGSAENGFKDVGAYDLNAIFHDLCVHEGHCYVASNQGLFRFDGKTILPLDFVFGNGDRDVMALDVKDGILWCFGYRSVARFDGHKWAFFAHPDNI